MWGSTIHKEQKWGDLHIYMGMNFPCNLQWGNDPINPGKTTCMRVQRVPATKLPSLQTWILQPNMPNAKEGTSQKIMSILDFLWKNQGINVNPWIPPKINKRPCFWGHPCDIPHLRELQLGDADFSSMASGQTRASPNQTWTKKKKRFTQKNIKTCGASCNLLYRWIRSETKKHRDLNPQQEGHKRTLDRGYHRNH